METEIEKTNISFGVVLETGNDEDLFRLTIKSFQNIQYPKDKLVINMSAKTKELHLQILLNELENLKRGGIKTTLTTHLYLDDKFVYDTDSFAPIMNSSLDYICRIKAGTEIDDEFLNFVNDNVNNGSNAIFHDLKENICFLSRTQINDCYLDYNNYDLMVLDFINIFKENNTKYITYEKIK